jgi:hypothetical protein
MTTKSVENVSRRPCPRVLPHAATPGWRRLTATRWCARARRRPKGMAGPKLQRRCGPCRQRRTVRSSARRIRRLSRRFNRRLLSRVSSMLGRRSRSVPPLSQRPCHSIASSGDGSASGSSTAVRLPATMPTPGAPSWLKHPRTGIHPVSADVFARPNTRHLQELRVAPEAQTIDAPASGRGVDG